MTAAPTFRTWTGWLWLTLAAILIHALLPVGSPIARTTGSPFSSATVDVSTAPGRRLPPVEQVRTDDKPDGTDSAQTASKEPFAAPAQLSAAATFLATAVVLEPHHESASRPAAASGAGQARAPPLL